MKQRPEEVFPDRLVERTLRAWVGLVQTHALAVLTLAVVLAGIAAVYTGCCLGFKTSRSDLINPRDAQYQNWKNFEDEFGDDADIVVIVEGAEQARMISAVETVARAIKGYPQHFEKLCHRIRVDNLRAKGLYQLPLADVQFIRGRMESLRPLLLGTWQWLTAENTLGATRFKLMTAPGERPLDEGVRETVQGAAAMLESLAGYLRTGNVYRSPWRTLFAQRPSMNQLQEIPEYFFSDDKQMAFLRVMPVKNAKSFTGYAVPVKVIREIVARVSPAFPDLTFGVTGIPVLEDDEMQAAQNASGISTLLSVAGVAFLFIAGFRAFRHPMFGLTTLLICGCWTLGWTTLTVGHLNILSMSFIVTLIGMGIDYSIVWLSRYEANRTLGLDNFRANLGAAESVAPGILTSSLTTALSFLATLSTGFLGLMEMGWIAASGILLCVFGTFTVLPALLTLGGCRNVRVDPRRESEQPFCAWFDRRPVLVLAVLSLVAIALAYESRKISMDYNLLHLQSHGLASVEWEKKLIAKMGTSGFCAMAIADTAEDAARLRKQFEALPTVGRAVEIASLVPADQAAKTPLIQEIHTALAKLPAKDELVRRTASQPSALQVQLTQVEKLIAPAAASDQILVNQFKALAQTVQRELGGMAPPDQQERLGRFEQLWVADLVSQLRELYSVSTPVPVTLEDIPPTLLERYRGPSGRWIVQIFPKESIWDMEPLERFVNDVESVDPKVTGKPITAKHSLLQMAAGYKRSAWLALVIIFVCVWLDFRSVAASLLSMVPLGLGWLAMFGMMGLCGIAFNPANMIALPLILGIGVNYGVYMVHDYRRSEGTYYLCWRLARAIGLSALTTIVGFASLLCAKHWGMISIGLVLAIGVSACMLNVFLFLPAMLQLLSRQRLEEADTIPVPTLQAAYKSKAA